MRVCRAWYWAWECGARAQWGTGTGQVQGARVMVQAGGVCAAGSCVYTLVYLHTHVMQP